MESLPSETSTLEFLRQRLEYWRERAREAANQSAEVQAIPLVFVEHYERCIELFLASPPG
jgi:hypothetical protein